MSSVNHVGANNHLPAGAKDFSPLQDAERQPCEVWTRVMGYHRPVASFNTGKQGEHAERRFFRQPEADTTGDRP